MDTFEEGAWFHGQLYPERCDISPDGTKLIYFATCCDYGGGNNDFPSAWTAISKVPWLTALCTWPNGDTHFGGGLFATDTKIWLNQCFHFHDQPTQGSSPPSSLEISHEQQFWDHDWHELFRLEQGGWKAIEPYPWGMTPKFSKDSQGAITVVPTDPNCLEGTPAYIRTVHEKNGPHGAWTLVMTSTYEHICQFSRSYGLRNNSCGTTTPVDGAAWADWDKKGRLVYARDGKVFAAEPAIEDPLTSIELADFNALRPHRTKSPAWAREW